MAEGKYSSQVLEETPPRAAKLLNAIGAEPVIRTLMAQAGMTDEDIAEGGKLLLACWAQPPSVASNHDTPEAKLQRAATAELDQWDEPHFGRFSATLRRHHPSAGAYVFHNLTASTGAGAVAGVATFLNRVDVLEKGSDPARVEQKKDDKKAVELLASRGLDKKERARLGELVKVALQPTGSLPAAPEADAKREAAREAALTALKDWFEEWAASARAVVKKRGYLIRLGLANRKVAKKDKGTTPPA